MKEKFSHLVQSQETNLRQSYLTILIKFQLMYESGSIEKPKVLMKVKNEIISNLGGAKHMANCFYLFLFFKSSIILAYKQKFPPFSFRTLPPRTSVRNCSDISVFIKHSVLLKYDLFCISFSNIICDFVN